MVEDNKTISSLFGGWGLDAEVDFPLGAKPKSYPTTSSATQFKHEAEIDWLDTYEFLGEDYNPFEDVLIPDSIPNNPDDFFKELEKHDNLSGDLVTPHGLSANPLQPEPFYQNYETQQQYMDIQPAKPEVHNIQINLKRVKLPKSKPFKEEVQNPYQFLSEPEPISSHVPNIVGQTVEETSKPNFTLKDAIDMGCADDILAQLMHNNNNLFNHVGKLMHNNNNLYNHVGKLMNNNNNLFNQISSFASSDSEESYSSDCSSPTYSSSFSPVYSPLSSPSSSAPVIELDNCTITPRDSFLSPYRSEDDVKETGSSIHTKSVKKSGRTKLTTVEKKLKKMEQNKRAATRYRQKKKIEESDASEKLKAEEDRHKLLNEKYKGLKQEIRVMKKLMREVFIAKGMISADAFKN